MMTLQDKTDVLRDALMSISKITARGFRDAIGASEAEKYGCHKTAFDDIAKVVASVVRRDLFGDDLPMNAETTKKLHALVRLCNEIIAEPDTAAKNAQIIKAELIKLIDAPSAANAPRNKVQVIRLPDTTALAYNKAFAPELPRLTAYVATMLFKDGKQQDCKIYLGNDVLAELTVYRNRSFAVHMVRQALKGAMSRLGKHRRHTANKQKKEGK